MGKPQNQLTNLASSGGRTIAFMTIARWVTSNTPGDQ